MVQYKQTINNACGLYGILHAVSNGDSRHFISKSSMLLQLIVNLLAARKPTSIIP